MQTQLAQAVLSTTDVRELKRRLRRRLAGAVYVAGDDGYDEARQAWNLQAEHRPALVVRAAHPGDISAAVRFAHDAGLGVGVLATGHGTGRPCNGGLLVNTSALRRVEIDPVARRATVQPGAIWSDVIAATAVHGLTGLPGSSPRVGVVGFTLGGGFGWLGRRFGLAAHSITRAQLITADGSRRIVSSEENADLFWGLGGGTDNFGIVTELEFALHPVAEVYGGNLYFGLERSREVLSFFAHWARTAPTELTAAVTFRTFPPLPALPAALRGGSFIAIRGAFCGEVDAGKQLIDQVRRALGPAVLDTFGPMPTAAMASISLDPVDPLGAIGHSELIRDLSPGLVENLVELAGPGSTSPLVMLELRQLGGALGGPPGALSPLAHTTAAYSLNAIGLAPTAERAETVRSFLRGLANRLQGNATGNTYLNFVELENATPERVRAAYSAPDWARLVRLKDRYDPDNTFRSNRNIPPSATHRPLTQQQPITRFDRPAHPNPSPTERHTPTMSTVLITGPSGTVGGPLTALLQSRGVTIRTLSARGAELPDPQSLAAALDGVQALYLSCPNAPGQLEYETTVIDAAARAGVGRIVKLSARGAERGSPVAFWDWHARIEEHLAVSGVPSTVLQPSYFMTNLLAGAEQIRQAGMLFAPAGSAVISMIDPRDVAAAAATALTADGHLGHTYLLTGPAAIGYQQVADELSAATGRQIGYLDVPPPAAQAAMVESGVPEFAAQQIVAVFAALRRGDQGTCTEDLRMLTGRPGRALAAFAADNAGAFRAAKPAA